jgi:D-serine deaminase-like pyridoxal phosphate-dependent protein
MARAGLGEDLLLANEVADATRLGTLARTGARVTVAVDSEETIDAAARAGVPEVLVDVNVGLPRCGCAPQDAGRLAERARARGLTVRGVMGYEGHVVGLEDRATREDMTAASMGELVRAHELAGGDVVSAGGTGTYDINTWATEIQAGSYALMDTAYAKLGLPFTEALTVLSTVISVSKDWVVADCGLKALGRGLVLLRRAPGAGAATPAPGRRPHPGAPGARRPDRGVPRAPPPHRRRGRRGALGHRPARVVRLRT